MRTPEYLSPSSLKQFEKDRVEFYIKYLADNRPGRVAQTQPMSVGSAFDGYVKSYIHYALFGNYGKDNEYELDTIFTNQVEAHNRDFARPAGEYVFKRYSHCGALSDMMLDLNKAAGPPRFEFSIQGVVRGEIGAIPLLGKPDIFFISDRGGRVIWDWKVNGYCGASGTSPVKGYTKCRDTWSSLEWKASRNNGMAHKDCWLKDHLGIQINGTQYMEDCSTEWADQLAIYAWLSGEEIGSENLIVGIDQIVSNGYKNPQGFPYLRVANHRSRISANYQYTLLDRLNRVWSAIKSGHIFGEMSREANDIKIAELEKLAETLSATDPMSKFVNAISREW